MNEKDEKLFEIYELIPEAVMMSIMGALGIIPEIKYFLLKADIVKFRIEHELGKVGAEYIKIYLDKSCAQCQIKKAKETLEELFILDPKLYEIIEFLEMD